MSDALAPATRHGVRLRRWLVGVGGLAAVVGAVFAWPWLRAGRHLEAANQAMERGDYDAALQALGRAEALQPRRAHVQFLLAVASRRKGRLEQFQQHWQRAAEWGSPEEDLRLQQMLAVAQTGNVPAVERPLREAIDRGAPDHVAEQIYEAIAQGHLAAYRVTDATVCLDYWITWRPHAPRARILRAMVQEQHGNYAKAADEYRAVLDVYPDHRDARLRLGDALLQANDLDEAREQFQTLVAADPNDSMALLGLGQVERRLGAPADARQHLEAALATEIDPYRRGIGLGELGRVLLGEGRTEEAIAALTKALDYVPMEWPVHHALGTALARLGQTEKAKQHMEMYVRTRKKFDRMTDITRLLIKRPNDADLRSEAGAILLEHGLKKEGADWLLTALGCDPAHRKTHELLANYYAELGNHRLAAEHRLLAAASPAEKPPPKPARPVPP